MNNNDLLTSRSFYFKVRDGVLIEIPIVEYVYNLNQNIKSIIKSVIDPQSIYDQLMVTILNQNCEEKIFLDDANLQQTITIATFIGIPENQLNCNENCFIIKANTGDDYVFDCNVLENMNDSILKSFVNLIVEAHEIGFNDTAHLFLPHWINSYLASSILEIIVDPNTGPNVTVIDISHPRRTEIEMLYSN